jgi:histidyl-tRNA synthetase
MQRDYEEVRTPTLEYLHLFTSTGTLTPGRLSRVYSFLDWDGWSGERVVLRPDGTIPIARLYVDTMSEREVAKLFYITNVFIFEETGKETREKWQCGVELIGTGSTLADVELIALAMAVLKKLGLKDIELRLSHAGLIRVLLTRFGLSPEEQTKVFDQILDGDGTSLEKLKIENPELGKTLLPLLGLKGESSGFLKNMRTVLNQALPELEPPFNNFIEVTDLLESLGCHYQVDIASGRGFEYYTGVIFQLFAQGKQVGGGGRYDALLPLLGGKDTPASGFALYLDDLMELIKLATCEQPLASTVLIRVESQTDAVLKEAFSLVSYLHEAGYVAEIYLGGEEPAALRWRINIQEKAPAFVVTDVIKHKKFKAQNGDEVLSVLGKR